MTARCPGCQQPLTTLSYKEEGHIAQCPSCLAELQPVVRKNRLLLIVQLLILWIAFPAIALYVVLSHKWIDYLSWLPGLTLLLMVIAVCASLFFKRKRVIKAKFSLASALVGFLPYSVMVIQHDQQTIPVTLGFSFIIIGVLLSRLLSLCGFIVFDNANSYSLRKN